MKVIRLVGVLFDYCRSIICFRISIRMGSQVNDLHEVCQRELTEPTGWVMIDVRQKMMPVRRICFILLHLSSASSVYASTGRHTKSSKWTRYTCETYESVESAYVAR